MVYYMMLSLVSDGVLLNSGTVKELLKYLNITSCLLVGRDWWDYMDCSKHLTFYLQQHVYIFYINTCKISP
jgi:hypothetical protein